MNGLRRLLPLLGLMLAGVGQAQPTYTVVASESRLAILGRSTVGPFTCEATRIDGVGRAVGGGASEVSITAPVQGFDCGNRRMNQDLYEALRAESHPTIRFTLREVGTVRDPADGNGPYRIEATGDLSIAGRQRRIVLSLHGHRLPDGTLRATGRKPLRMTDFGVTPPTALMGLVKAQDEIEIVFDVIAAPGGAGAQRTGG